MEKVKVFNVRLPKSMWLYMKRAASEREVTMNHLVNELLIKFKNKREKKLNNNDTVVE